MNVNKKKEAMIEAAMEKGAAEKRKEHKEKLKQWFESDVSEEELMAEKKRDAMDFKAHMEKAEERGGIDKGDTKLYEGGTTVGYIPAIERAMGILE